MNARRTAALGAAMLVAAGCGLVAFDVTVEADTVIQGGGTIFDQLASLGFQSFGGIDLSTTQEFENRDVRPEDVDSITLKRVVLEITDPSDVDFSFLNSLEFYVEAPGQPKVLVAQSAPGAFDGTRRVEMEIVDGVELKPYATAESMSLTTQANADGRPSADTTVHATVVFHVDPNLGGS